MVSPVLHKLPVALLLVSTTEPPSQKATLAEGEIVGVCTGLTITSIGSDVAEQPFTSIVVTDKFCADCVTFIVS